VKTLFLGLRSILVITLFGITGAASIVSPSPCICFAFHRPWYDINYLSRTLPSVWSPEVNHCIQAVRVSRKPLSDFEFNRELVWCENINTLSTIENPDKLLISARKSRQLMRQGAILLSLPSRIDNENPRAVATRMCEEN
jgi:hypothetical protein